jgi:hypothetical protein
VALKAQVSRALYESSAVGGVVSVTYAVEDPRNVVLEGEWGVKKAVSKEEREAA